MSRTALGAALLLCSLVLTGCGGTTSSPAADETAAVAEPTTGEPAAATGAYIEGPGFSFRAPEGWQVFGQNNRLAAIFSIGAAERSPADGLGDHLSVMTKDPSDGYDDLEELAADSLAEFKNFDVAGAEITDVASEPSVLLDGADAAHITAIFTAGEVPKHNAQYLTVHDGQALTITFSFDIDRAESERQDLAAAVLASWQWTS